MSGAGGIGGVGPLGRDPSSTLDSLRSGRIQGREERMKAAADLMESSFFQELFKALRATVPEGGLAGGGTGEDVFSGLLDQHLADVAAGRLERGLGEALYRRFAGTTPAAQENGEGADARRMENSKPSSAGGAE